MTDITSFPSPAVVADVSPPNQKAFKLSDVWLCEIPEYKTPVIVRPFYGEFGHKIMSFVPAVNALRAPKIIVCCAKGDEPLFPRAAHFYYDWRNPFPDNQRSGIRNRCPARPPDKLTAEEIELQNQLEDTHPEYSQFRLDYPLMEEFAARSMPIVRLANNPFPKVDVVIGARYRQNKSHVAHVQTRTFFGWGPIVEALHSAGYSVGQIGLPDTSVQVECTVNAWQFDNANLASIGMLEKATLYIGTDTGTTHLAAVIGTPIICFRCIDHLPGEGRLGLFTRGMARERGSYFEFLPEGWENSDVVIETALHYLARRS